MFLVSFGFSYSKERGYCRLFMYRMFYLGSCRKHDLREATLRPEVLAGEGFFSSVKTVKHSPVDFLGDANRLSGRICSKL